jgi:hypothetical protein
MSKSEPGLRVPLEDWRDSAQHSGADAERPGSVSLLESHPVQVLWSSLDAPWIDVLKVEKVRIRKGDVPEFCVSEHSIGLRLSPPGMVDMRYAGEPPHHSLAHPGDFCLSPQGALLSARQYRRADFLAVALAPTFVSAVAEQAAEGQSVELTNPCSVRDAVVHHLVLALAAEAEAGCPRVGSTARDSPPLSPCICCGGMRSSRIGLSNTGKGCHRPGSAACSTISPRISMRSSACPALPPWRVSVRTTSRHSSSRARACPRTSMSCGRGLSARGRC